MTPSPRKKYLHFSIFAFSLGALLFFSGCAGGNQDKMYVPDDIPDVCKDIDFRQDAELRKVCGVKTKSYMAYRNIPEHRSLLEPKGGKIIQKGSSLQLRLENFLPIELPDDFKDKIKFGESMRRTLLKSKMEYFEFYPPEASRPERLIHLMVPLDNYEVKSVCFTVERKDPTLQRKTGYASTLLPLNCQDFERLKSPSTTSSPSNSNIPK